MNLLVIMSHKLQLKQKEESIKELRVTQIKELPNELLNIWNSIDPKGDLPVKELKKIIQWIDTESKPNDYILIQGEYGSTFYVVDYCFKNNRIPIYVTTNRIVIEEKKEDKVIIKRTFNHVSFRRYIRFS